MKQFGKKTKLTVFAAVLLCGVIIAGGIFMLFNRNTDEPKVAAIKEITQLESLTVRFSGMRLTSEYEIIANGDTSELSLYYFNYADGEEKRVLSNSVTCDTQEVIDKLNACGAGRWNGFHGKHPRGVLDGTMFTLSASVNDGQRLNADGSQNFPKNFRDFEQWLYEKLN